MYIPTGAHSMARRRKVAGSVDILEGSTVCSELTAASIADIPLALASVEMLETANHD
jgi:hypothetical protein